MYPLLMLSLFSSLVGVQVIKAQQEVMDVLTVRVIQVVNEKKEPVIMIGANENQGGGIWIYDEKGIPGVILGSNVDVRSVGIYNADGDNAMIMVSSEHGNSLYGYGKNNLLRLTIDSSKLTYYNNNTLTGVTTIGSELSRDGLKVGYVYPAHYKSNGVSYNGVGGFKLPRNITN